ncbi:probable UDP-N-acetylmuramoylalanyl-D-glutamate--2,6-diaminopimelateligase [Halobacteriovorax marinus SJ]|uniref:Probable UDP-N-acetylmuramoylalanyl-D-glutamate--2,6-diaminopimelate ligase n=1 Tax=Halobacteriovorax marinus (strain ATCC BAA-682 / DSM 15412 / SJ) TaxID=862908 RepID=E1X245_HALMS|nr:UDP-N-acetylmuramoyl-L-alanyl-D-glutamate--2,6-diaminopimelate ligase [Halobacteriovorax marinus]CBW25001.1 probable UDP-N-acetylmuramoylalanyl-D-glutamate--2,6-diaminopimelateligase [Halobacteriovorax marinus SJ]
MNKKDITKILSENLLFEKTVTDCSIKQATTNLQLAGEDSLCFYNISDQLDAKEVFIKRLKSSSCKNLVLTKKVDVEGVNIWVVDPSDFLWAQDLIANEIYPDKLKIKLAGITGTNGKTTVSYLAMQLATLLGYPSISIGTIGVRDSKNILEEDILSTTPSYLELRKIIHRYQDDYKFIFMEVSSHALAQNRLNKVRLKSCAWTSFSQDHLDYHKTNEEYFKAKLKILESSDDKNLIVPSSEKSLLALLADNNVSRKIVEPYFDECLEAGFKASYNQANLSVAIALCEVLIGESIDRKLLSKLSLPAGRFEAIKYNEHIVIVDYAHTPDALENICGTIKKDFSSFELRVIFGCGGDRDRSKRPLMGKAVSKYADNIIVTSDNPRTEEPSSIIDDITPGISRDYIRIEDRRLAIEKSLEDLSRPTVVLIAGKGHEEYQDVKGIKHHFSDKEEVMKIIDRNKNV